MVRDMMVPADMPLNELSLGHTDGAPRAIPQDTLLSIFLPLLSTVWVVAAVVLACCIIGVLYSGWLARRLLGASLPVQLVVSLLVIWNPFTVERLLQGQWSVVIAMWLLPALAYASMYRHIGWTLFLLGVCAITPTGWILGAVVALICARSLKFLLLTLLALVLLSAPWVLVTLFHNPQVSTDALSAQLFAPRAEPGVGTLGALAGLSGIWNAEVVPDSRTLLSSLLSIVLFFFMAFGAWRLFKNPQSVRPGAGHIDAARIGMAAGSSAVRVSASRVSERREATLHHIALRLVGLSFLAILLPFLFSTGPGVLLLGWIGEHIPGAGLLRDSQKYVALAMPGMVLMLASALIGISERWKSAVARTAFSALAGAMIIGTVPLLPSELSPLQPRPLAPEWTQIINEVSQSHNCSVLLLPPGNYRMHDGIPVVDPALKLLPGHPIDPGFLIVDGHVVDGNLKIVRLLQQTMKGEDRLADSGVGWVLVDRNSFGPAVDTAEMDKMLSAHKVVVSGSGLELYAVNKPHPLPPEKSHVPLYVGIALYSLVLGLGLLLSMWRYVLCRDPLGITSQPDPAESAPISDR